MSITSIVRPIFVPRMRALEKHLTQGEELQREVLRLAAALGVSVYGGDAIVRADGSFCLIDFNDWPSFSRCREEAADAIASLVLNSKFVNSK